MSMRIVSALLASLLTASCATTQPLPPCPSGTRTIVRAPRVSEAQLRAEYWLSKLTPTQANQTLVSRREIHLLNRRNAQRPWAYQDVTSPKIGIRSRIEKEIGERITWLDNKFKKGLYLEAVPGAYQTALSIMKHALPVDELKLITRRVDLRCVPTNQRFRTPRPNSPFDRNQCSALRTGSLVRVLKRTKDGVWTYVHAGHSVGWLYQSPLSKALSLAEAREQRDGLPRRVSLKESQVLAPNIRVALGASFPAEKEGTILVPIPGGLTRITPTSQAKLHPGFLPLTRKHLFTLAFSQLNRPYGWGDMNGKTDCSGFLMDLFATFGVRLGRHSSDQAKSGTWTRSLDGLGRKARLNLIRDAGQRGIVLLYMPGHIMLYIGEAHGKPYAISSIYETTEACAGHQDRELVLARTTVTDLDIGKGTLKTSFLTRLRRITVFGPPR